MARHNRISFFTPTLALAFCILLPASAHAWGGDGHQLVALIAEDRLTPAAKAGIHDLLGKDVNISDGDVASWADEIRNDRPETGPWHYVDIPVSAPTTAPTTALATAPATSPVEAYSFDEQRDGQKGNNVIDKITDFENVLKDPKATKDDKAEALKFVVHLVGDLHQPLHCAERNKDRGGNGRMVFFLDWPDATNLHSVWDGAILRQRRGDMRNAAYADKLNAAITPEQAAEWSKGTSEDWANQSHDIALKVAYAGVSPDRNMLPKLDQKYVDAGGLVVDQQLQRAGVRLAMILNDIFK